MANAIPDSIFINHSFTAVGVATVKAPTPIIRTDCWSLPNVKPIPLNFPSLTFPDFSP